MKPRAAAAALGIGLLIACQGPGTTSPSPRPSASASALQEADARLFGGDYEGAEAAYRSLVTSGEPGAGAHLALLLDYESRFQEAVAAASAEAGRHPDSGVLARLTRAYDWADDIPAALDAGRRAIDAKPVDPLAHVFYSEALADAGRFADAEAQLRAANAAGDPYVRSETYREWANYHRDRGDTQSELNNMQLSLRAQPRFPERQLELARYYYVAKRPDAAHAALSQASHGAASGAVLAAAGDAAFVAGDFEAAAGYYQDALGAAPAMSEPVLAMALIAVAAKRDFKAAHDALVEVLRKEPGNGSAYEFLWQLDRYVLKTDPASELGPLSPSGGAVLDSARRDAIETVNALRQSAGVAAVAEDHALDTAAEEHAWYTVFNLGQQSLSGLGVHGEDPSLPGFVGANSILRDRAAGYGGNRGAEVIDHVFTSRAAVGVWEHSVYHRFPLLGPDSHAAGYGEVIVGPLSVAVMDLGLSEAPAPSPVAFPADGQKDVPTAFTGNEVPDPAPHGAHYPVGYPVTLQVGGGSGLTVSSGKLTGSDGKEIAAWLLEPNKEVDSNEWALLPQQPLVPGATYTVDVAGAVDGRPFSRRWSFTTTGAA